ncbi:MAG: hypothetical protein R3C11_27065 [Planctomycetaceae bacterium]
MLHYADTLASDETSGDMDEMYKWLFSSTKKHISSAQLLTSLPTEAEICLEASFRWYRGGRDLDDWLFAERELKERVWDQL